MAISPPIDYMSTPDTTIAALARRQRIWQGLWLLEWWRHRPLLLMLGTIYALSPVVALLIPLGLGTFAPRGAEMLAGMTELFRTLPWLWSIFMGLGLAVILGLTLGGTETTAGLEEGSLSLPPTRAQYFQVRLTFGLSLLGLHMLLNSLALLSWDRGLVRPDLHPNFPLIWLGLAILAPLTLFALAWTVAVNGGPRRRILMGLGAVGLVFLAGQCGRLSLWLQSDGSLGAVRVALPDWMFLACFGWSVWMLYLSYMIYNSRDIHALQDN